MAAVATHMTPHLLHLLLAMAAAERAGFRYTARALEALARRELT